MNADFVSDNYGTKAPSTVVIWKRFHVMGSYTRDLFRWPFFFVCLESKYRKDLMITGEPPQTGTATVRIYTKNKNDEEPKFSQQVYTPNVDENAGPNTLVTTVVASDKDGDNVKFGFVGGGTSSGQFVIEEITGVIRLHSKPITLDRDKYELNVTAVDDGSCCLNGDLTIHTSTAVVVVFITDVNDNKPIFKDCAKYNPKISEGTANGHEVIKVRIANE